MKAKAVKLIAKAGCGAGADCPAILRAEDGGFLIIGKKMSSTDLSGLANVGADEEVIYLPKELEDFISGKA